MNHQRRGGARRLEQAAHDVLDGRVQVRARELLELIHEINPTGRSSSAADERRRYELKSRLQSLLVRAFGDDIVVTGDADGIVAIGHRYLGRDACHARVDDLDDDARARVRMLLDVEGWDPTVDGIATVADHVPGGTSGPIERGRAALAEYDYETARACFEAGLASSGSELAATRALLELLVDHLVLDEDALAIESRLSESVASNGEVRALLAMAAARSGDDAKAEGHLRGLIGTRAADAWVVLARAAFQRGDALLDRYLGELERCDRAHPELHRLRDDVSRARAEAWKPAEHALQRMYERGDLAGAEVEARSILDRWPESTVAGKVLGRIQADRDRAESERLIEGARSALADGQPVRAAELMRHARWAGAEADALADQIRAAVAAERAASNAATVAAVGDSVTNDADPRPGLRAYLALDPELRRCVRDRAAAPMLEWLEAVAAPERRMRSEQLLEAVLAFRPAIDALDRGDDDQVLALLEPHDEVLATVPRAKAVRAEAQRRITARRRELASVALEHAERALADDDLARCEHHCTALDRRDLDTEMRARLDRVTQDLRGRRELARRGARVDELVATGDLLGARRELESLLANELVGAARAPALRARLEEVRGTARRVWCVRAIACGRGLDELDPVGELLGSLPYVDSVGWWLVAGGHELVIATAFERHVFLARVAVDEARVVGRVYLRAPLPFGSPSAACIDGETLWVAGHSGQVLQVAWETGEPLRWESLIPFVTGPRQIERVMLFPDASHLWLELYAAGAGASDLIIDIEKWRVRRELTVERYFRALVTSGEPRVIGTGFDGGAVVYTERGVVVEQLAACAAMRVSAVTADPSGELVVLGSRADDETNQLEIVRLSAGHPTFRQPLTDSNSERALQCACAHATGLLFIHHYVDGDESRLVVRRLADGGLEPAYEVRAPWSVVFVQDAGARQVVCLWDSAAGIKVETLGSRPPAFDDLTERRNTWSIPALADYMPCHPHSGEQEDPAYNTLEAANEAARAGEWDRVRALLEVLPPHEIAPGLVPHLYHLLGIALFRAGDPARARAAWETGMRSEQRDEYFRCPFASCLDLIEPMPAPLPVEWWGPEASIVRQLRGAIVTADRFLAANDPRGALGVLRRRSVTRSGELQSFARLAAAWLAIDPQSAEERFDKALALSRFTALGSRGGGALAIEDAWPAEQLANLAERCEHWLDRWAMPDEDRTAFS